jgi:hypothetical protein
MNSYIFILCPPYSGSTLLWKLISTSSSVSSLPKEGQFLPEVQEVMRQDPWNEDIQLPWDTIKEVWDGYWDRDKDFLLEKSPPNITRTNDILTHFNPVYFLLMLRNPYAHCEGLIRRNKWKAQKAADFTVRCMRQQMENAQNLDNTICFTYEELVGNTELISNKIESFLPKLGNLKHTQTFKVRSIDGVVERGIVDLNKKKISNLSVRSIKIITNTLKKNPDVMDYWKYEYIEPSRQHALNYYQTKLEALKVSVTTAPKRISTKITNRFINRSTN